MRTFFKGFGLIGCSGALVVLLGAGGVAAKPPAKQVKVSCTSTAYNVSYPQLSGLALGVLQCSKPFGSGVQKAKNKATIAGTKVTVTGTFTNYFASGTNHGTLQLSGTLSTGAINASGHLTVTGGTGAYKHIKGTGTVSCTTKDAGKTYKCKVSGKATM